jgi:hypothetical protein
MSQRLGWARFLAFVGIMALHAGCTQSGGGSATGSGGRSGTVPATGGNAGSGGTSAASSGGAPATGGTSAPGGFAAGGSQGAGGAPGSGGTMRSGGTMGSGGANASGGSPGSGGAAGSGGTSTNTGGTTTGSGGVQGSGGASATGGASGSGGTTTATTVSGNCPGSCPAPTPTSCSSPEVRISQVSLGSNLSYSTDETYNIPLAIAAKPGGGSLIAWMTGYSKYGSSTASQVHIAELDCEDKLVGTPFTMEAHDFQDLAADGDGGVIVLTRDGQGTDAQHCGDVNNLCVLPSDRPGCYDMYMVRFDCAGTEQWAAKLTTTSASAPLYTSGSGTNLGVWWYQHHGRIATDGTNYAAYFCDSITVTNNSCSAGAGKVDIHEGDRMQVVDPTGKVLTGHDSFSVGCSHSWTTRMVWDARSNHFVMVCATDNNCRIAQPNPYRTIASATCDGTLFGGDVVLAGDTGYWTAWSYQKVIKLEHFTTGASDRTVTTAGNTQNPHLVSLGASNMLLTWKSGTGLAAQIYDTSTGDPVGEQFTIAAPDHPWQSWKAFPDGSVTWASVSSATSTVQIARVMPCAN